MNKSDLYLKAIEITSDQFDIKNATNQDILKKLIFYGVKYTSERMLEKSSSYEEVSNRLDMIMLIDKLIKGITFNEFINMFPITKQYDGKKYECKDYFSTIQYLNTVDLCSKIEDNVDNLLINYYNSDIARYQISKIMLIDELRWHEGKCSLLEEWVDTVNLDVNICKKKTDLETGREYMIDRNGRTFGIEKPKSKIRHLKVVK